MIFVVLNLHMLILVGVWVGENLAGFEWAALAAGLSLVHNPTYVLVLILLASVVLAPYGEAVNYLFYVDSRARYEGLDLWYRVHRHFRLRNPADAVLALTVDETANQKSRFEQTPLLGSFCCLLFLAWPSSVQAADALTSVRTARREISVIRQEVKTKELFPGGEFWAVSASPS